MTLLHEKPNFLNFADGKLNNADKILTHASHVFYMLSVNKQTSKQGELLILSKACEEKLWRKTKLKTSEQNE